MEEQPASSPKPGPCLLAPGRRRFLCSELSSRHSGRASRECTGVRHTGGASLRQRRRRQPNSPAGTRGSRGTGRAGTPDGGSAGGAGVSRPLRGRGCSALAPPPRPRAPAPDPPSPRWAPPSCFYRRGSRRTRLGPHGRNAHNPDPRICSVPSALTRPPHCEVTDPPHICSRKQGWGWCTPDLRSPQLKPASGAVGSRAPVTSSELSPFFPLIFLPSFSLALLSGSNLCLRAPSGPSTVTLTLIVLNEVT